MNPGMQSGLIDDIIPCNSLHNPNWTPHRADRKRPLSLCSQIIDAVFASVRIKEVIM